MSNAARPPAGDSFNNVAGAAPGVIRVVEPSGDVRPAIPLLAVVGVGLIGGSYAAALRRAGHVGRVLGVGRNAQSLTRAYELDLIDDTATAPRRRRRPTSSCWPRRSAPWPRCWRKCART